jgi:hypothetical protein
MTSLSRKMKRAAYARVGKEWPTRQQPTVTLPNGGYMTLRPTKGWLYVSPRRLRAQNILRHIAELIAARKRAA